MAKQITDQNASEVMAAGGLVVVDFWATWCGPCQRVAPIVEELAAEYEGRATIGKYNVDEGEDLSAEFGIRNIPTLVFVKDGKLVDRMVGAASKAEIKAKIDQYL